MSSKLGAYVSFQGQAREAMEFYREVFGGTLAMNTFDEFGETGPIANQLMHSQLETPSGYTLMGSDVPPGMEYSEGTRITLILHGDDATAGVSQKHRTARTSLKSPVRPFGRPSGQRH